ncbi:putative adenosinetriphosphatase [Lupinus albus]|uniref:Putative adenosinetriphosphatase n=1 Tax=Lupinus albus TaxID=3870 RepID=A0A6A4P807_LUPAL|nr:putative adenosinetriphosphatase [Lupinus albus]
MAILQRLWRLRSFQTLTSHSSLSRTLPRSSNHNSAPSCSTASQVSSSRIVREAQGSFKHSMLPALLAVTFGFGLVETAYADDSANKTEDVESIAVKERYRIEELLRSRGIRYGSYPRFTVAVKGQKVSVKFQIPPACEISQLIVNLTANLGLKAEGNGGGSDMSLRAWDSTVAWQLTLTHPSKQKHIQENDPSFTDINAHDGDLCVLIFHSLIGSDKAEIEFIKEGSLSPEELDAFVSILQLAGNKTTQRNTLEKKPREENEQVPSADVSISSLEAMGVRIYGLDEPIGISNGEISWDNIAGYEHQKRVIEDTILLALHSPEVYDDIARETRHKFESNRPRAVLFEGPPGTGKTSCARVIANQAGVPLLYVPLEIVMSEYYGKSERLLGKVFSLANGLPNGAIIFLDEVDSFAAARDSEMHEATRRILSVLLRQIDGFEQDKKVVVIAATNRKEDLDPALISRFDTIVAFGLPDHHNRQEIASKYAKHLTKPELDELASVTENMSGRDIRDVCLQAERSWASKIIRGQVSKDGERGKLPPLQEYIVCATNRLESLRSTAEDRKKRSSSRQRTITG